jgi:hypothetical protein
VSKDSDVAAVVARLDELLDKLRGNVNALNAILIPPSSGGGEANERLVPQ